MATIQRVAVSIVGLWALMLGATAHSHWLDQPPHQTARMGTFPLERGGVIENLEITYVTHGRLNAARNNAVIYLHPLGVNHHHLDHFIGPGRPLDTDRYFIVCPDLLGATQTTFEHSTSPTASGLKMQFPFYNGRDVVRAVHLLAKDVLGIEHLVAVAGVARGGALAVQFAVSYPGYANGLAVIAGGARWGSTASLLVSQILSFIEQCDEWQNGEYDENPKACVANAMSSLIPYMFTPEWWARNVDTPEAYTRWRNIYGEYFFDIQDARDLYYVLKSGALGSLADTPGFGGNLDSALHSIRAKTLFVGNPRDFVIVAEHLEAQARAIPDAKVVWIDSAAGHSICCNADPQATRAVGEALRAFLREAEERHERSQ